MAHFLETETWHLLIPIDIEVMKPCIEFTGARKPTVPDNSYVQVPLNYNFIEIFERNKFDGKFVGKGEWHNLVNCLIKFQSHNVFKFFLYYNIFSQMVRICIILLRMAFQIQCSYKRKF